MRVVVTAAEIHEVTLAFSTRRAGLSKLRDFAEPDDWEMGASRVMAHDEFQGVPGTPYDECMRRYTRRTSRPAPRKGDGGVAWVGELRSLRGGFGVCPVRE